ncbi:MAG: glutathione S-transferase [unclassified Hahellaceae]|nr:glutathione S-transferase [Hahellaceae bacterium]|tara:strand:- start:25873 stop:26484 length:612 start_codon:yes stop_codon:yes gene_type:complete
MLIYEMKIAPSPRRVRIFLAEKGISNIEYKEINLQTGENRTPEFRAISPFGLVPVLELDDGTHIAETLAICRYFEELQPEPPLYGRNPKEKALVEQWNRFVELNFFMPTGMCFQHTSSYFAKFKTQVPAWGELCRKGVHDFIERMEKHFADNEYLVGDYYSIADISAYCALDFSKVNDIRLGEQHVNTRRWHEAMKSRASAKA